MALTNLETTIILDLYDYDTTPSTIKAIQLDSNTRYVAAVIRNKGGIYDIGQSATVTLTVIRPDKVGVQITGSPRAQSEMTPDEQVITTYGAYAELSQAALAVKGTLYAQFMFTSGSQILRTEIFSINCGEALDASTDTWAGEYQGYNLDELVQFVNESVAKVNAMEQDVSELNDGFSELYNTAYITDSASGGVAHFEDGADNIPMKSVKVNIESVQSGSGDPNPSNVRPISGQDNVKVTRCGKNLVSIQDRTVVNSGITYTFADEVVTVNGTATQNVYFGTNSLLLKAGTYTAVDMSGNSTDNVYVLVSDTTTTPYWAVLANTKNGAVTFTLDHDAVCAVRIAVIRGTTVDNVSLMPMLVKGTTAPIEFESYNGDVYEVSLSSTGTVYGGMLDVVSGELTVDKKMVTIDGSTVQFTFASSNNTVADYKNAIFGIASVDALQSASASVIPDMIADKATAISYNAAASKTAENYGVTITDVGITTQTRVRVSIPKSQNVITVADANTWASSNPITVVYPLTNPLTYHLSATKIKSLLGINNIWSDAGDIDVEYRADTKLYIDKRLAEVTP